MSKIFLNVYKTEYEWHEWWHNFHDHYVNKGFDFDLDEPITQALAEWNAIDIPDTGDFYFENALDHMVFMLRWQ